MRLDMLTWPLGYGAASVYGRGAARRGARRIARAAAQHRHGALRPRAAPADARPVPEGVKKHIQVGSFNKQLTREQWTSRPLR